MLRVYGIVKVEKANVVTRNGKTYAKLTCTWKNGEESQIVVLVPVRKHANFLEGKTVYIDGFVKSDNIIVAELSGIWTVQTDFKRNGGNGSANANGGQQKASESHHDKPAADDDEIPF